MNFKKILHITLCAIFATSLFSCGGQDQNNPDSGTSYFIKHPWGGSDWTWQKMTQNGDGSYTYSGKWGGSGANINTLSEDNNSEWYSESAISGASSLSVGDQVTFKFVPTSGNNGSLSVAKSNDDQGGGQQNTGYFIKHPWGGSDWTWQQMTSAGNGKYTFSGKWGENGANINTKASDSGAEWYTISQISGASSLSKGTEVTFTFTPSTGNSGTLSVASNGGSNPGGGDDQQGSVPSAPTGLSGNMTGSAALGFSVNLAWNYVSDATSYNIYRSSSENGSYSKRGSTKSNSYSDSNISNGDYYYKVTAVNSTGESEKSSAVKVHVDKNAFKPDFSSVKGSISGGKVVVTWSTKSQDGYGAPEKVEAKIYDPNDKTWNSQTYTGSSASSGSHSWACAACYQDTYEKIQVSVIVTNSYGSNQRNLTYYNGNWIGNF